MIFWVSSLLSDCVKNFLHYWRRKFRKFVKTAFYLNKKTFSRKLCFVKKRLTLTNFSSFVNKFCGILSENLPNGLKNSFLHLIRQTFCITLSFPRGNVRLLTEFVEKNLEFGKNFLTPWSKLLSSLAQWNFPLKILFLVEKSLCF